MKDSVIALFAATILVLSIFGAVCAFAQDHPSIETDYGDFSMWGLASQGYVYSSRHSFFGSEEDPFNYREISLGGQYRMLDNLSMTMQGEYRDAGESDNLGLRMSQAYMDGYLEVTKDSIIGVNMGRIEIPFGFYNRTRDRIDTRPSILLPQSIYLDSLGSRESILTGDGGAVYGFANVTKNSRVEARIAAAVPSNRGDSILVSGWADYIYENLRLRLTMLQLDNDQQDVDFPVLGAQYTYGPWTGTVEYGEISLDRAGLLFETKGGYGQVEYAVNDDIGLFTRWDMIDVDVPAGFPISKERLKGNGFGIGGHYDINKYLRVNAEYHMVDGTLWLNREENPVNDGSDYDLFLLMLSVRF